MEWCGSQEDNTASPAPLLTVWCELLVVGEIVSEVTQLVAGMLSKHYILESINCLPNTPGTQPLISLLLNINYS